MKAPVIVDRRRVLAGSGALIVSFSLADAFAQDQAAPATAPAPNPPGSLKGSPFLDSWIRIDADGSITVFTGKAELGQGFKTAFQQISAEELDVPFESLKVVTADTRFTANEGYTSGSNSMKDSGTAIQNAAAQVRALLVAEAARRLDLPAENLRTESGAVISPDGRRLGYGELVAADMLHVQAQPKSRLKDPASFKVMGQAVPRVDIPAKVTGGAAYVQDIRLPGMVHARVVRPPSYGAQLTDCDTSAVEKLPGVVKVIRDGNFLAVVAKKEFQSIKAMNTLSAAAKWMETAGLPKQDDLLRFLTSLPSQDSTIFERADPSVVGQKTIEATYTRPYQAHGSIGPSCAVAQFVDGAMTVWTHTQGVYSDRLAEHVERLAHHAVRGRAWDQAVTFLREAGAKAFARSANRDAVAHYEEALSVQQHLPQSRTRDEDAIDLRFELRSALMVLGEFPRTLTVLREAQDLAKMLGDIRRLGWAAGYLSNLLWEMGEQDEAIGRGQEALDIAARLDDAALKYLALRYLGRSYHAIGQYRRGVEMFRRALASVEPAHSTATAGRPNPSVNSSRHFAALCLMELGAFPEAIEYAEAALSAVEGVDQAFNLAGSCAVLGYVHLRRGDVVKAIEICCWIRENCFVKTNSAGE